MIVTPDNKMLQYSGRIDFEDVMVPELVYPCSYIKMNFTGSFVKAIVSNNHSCWDNYLGYIIDDKQEKIQLQVTGKETIVIAEGLENKQHELIFFKRMDSCHTFKFYGFEIDDNAKLFPTVEPYKRCIEVYGDSVSAGEVSEAVAYVGQEDPKHQGEYSNSWYSYAWMTARKLNAQIHNVAQGGISLLNGTGWFASPHYLGIESTFDKIQYHPDLGPAKQWDFSKYTPHVVIIAIGQNDNHPKDYMAENYNGQKAMNWRIHYKEFVGKIRERYPDATIILATTILEHHSNWDKAIEDVSIEIEDKKVHHFLYSNNGCGTKGHIRISEADQMSDELSEYINSLGEEIWG